MSNATQTSRLLILFGIAITLVIVFLAWKIINPPEDSTVRPDACNALAIIKMCQSEEEHVGYNAGFENQFVAAAKSDLEILRQNGKIANLTHLESIYERYKSSKACVSEAFYKAYESKRSAICSYLALLKDESLELSELTRREAEMSLMATIGALSNEGETDPTPEPVQEDQSEIDQLITATKAKCVKMARISSQVKPEYRRKKEALIENCELAAQFIESTKGQFERGEVDESYFEERIRELEQKVADYEAEINSLIAKN